MQTSRNRLNEIVKEELLKYIKTLVEGPDVKSAETDKKKKDINPQGSPLQDLPMKGDKSVDNVKSKKSQTKDKSASEEIPPEEVPSPIEDKEQTEKQGVISLSKDLEGKSIQSVVLDTKSKTLPGAKEVVISFNDTPEPLKILVQQNGNISFMFKGIRHAIENK